MPLRRKNYLVLQEHVRSIAFAFVIYDLAFHVLGSIPVRLTTRGKAFTAINSHDMPSDPACTVIKYKFIKLVFETYFSELR